MAHNCRAMPFILNLFEERRQKTGDRRIGDRRQKAINYASLNFYLSLIYRQDFEIANIALMSPYSCLLTPVS
jgi:hypothetical protein